MSDAGMLDGLGSVTARACIDMQLCVLALDARALAAQLAALGPLSLDGAGETHPLCIELWSVREGRMQPMGIEQERLYAGYGFSLGALSGAWLGPLGSLSGALFGLSAGRALSSLATRTLGRYSELLIGIPNVRFREEAPSYFVAGMYTDSRYAQWMDHALGFGFGKRIAAFEGSFERGLSVRSHAGELLRASPDAHAAAPPPVDWHALKAALSRPLLAGAGVALARSTYLRAWPPDASVRRAVGALGVGAAFHPFIGAGEHTAAVFGAASVEVGLGLPVRVANGAGS